MRLKNLLAGGNKADPKIKQLVHTVLSDEERNLMKFGHQRLAEADLYKLAEAYVDLWQKRQGSGYAVNAQGRMEETNIGLIPDFNKNYRYFFCSVDSKNGSQQPEAGGPSIDSIMQDLRCLTAKGEAPGFDARVFTLSQQAMQLVENHMRGVSDSSLPLYDAKRMRLIRAVDKLFNGLDQLCQKRHGQQEAPATPDDAVESTSAALRTDWAQHAKSRQSSREQAAANAFNNAGAGR